MTDAKIPNVVGVERVSPARLSAALIPYATAYGREDWQQEMAEAVRAELKGLRGSKRRTIEGEIYGFGAVAQGEL